jgi:hypothetical protein
MIARWAGLPMSESVQGTRNGTPPTRGDLDLMPRYFFDIEDSTTSMRDAEGSELADLRTAQREAADSLIEMGRDVFRSLEHGRVSATICTCAVFITLRAGLMHVQSARFTRHFLRILFRRSLDRIAAAQNLQSRI